MFAYIRSILICSNLKYMAIYTRTGDRGTTSLMNGQRVSKAHLRVETYGSIDELNSAIGVVLAEVQSYSSKLKAELVRIQSDLFEIGSALANPKAKGLNYLEKRVKEFEKLIDYMTQKLPPLVNFILPGGGKAGSLLHLARAISRRVERKIVALNTKEKTDKNIIIYVNRLSDLLFTMARFANFKEKKKETIWTQRK